MFYVWISDLQDVAGMTLDNIAQWTTAAQAIYAASYTYADVAAFHKFFN